MLSMKLIRIYEAELSRRRTDLYIDDEIGIFVLEFFDDDGDFVVSTDIEGRELEYVESVAINWVASPDLCSSMAGCYKINVLLENINTITRELIKKQHNVNEIMINTGLDSSL